MGRASQLFWYLNQATHPKPLELKHTYSHIDISLEFKKARRKYRRELQKQTNFIHKTRKQLIS